MQPLRIIHPSFQPRAFISLHTTTSIFSSRFTFAPACAKIPTQSDYLPPGWTVEKIKTATEAEYDALTKEVRRVFLLVPSSAKDLFVAISKARGQNVCRSDAIP